MLMHEWLQFRDRNVRRLSEAQAEAEEAQRESTEAAVEAEGPPVAGDTGLDEAEGAAVAAAEHTAAGETAEGAAEPRAAARPDRAAAGAARARTPRPGAEQQPAPKTAREVLETLQPSADVRARLEAVLARQQRLPLGSEEDVSETRRPRRAAETREQLVSRLLDPTLSLQETALLLGVCPTTVRRYTNRGVMKCFRTPGNQRRFKLSDVLEFMERREHGEV